jgi:hypothetical protein
LASFSCLFRSEYKWILYLTTMYVYCVYPAMSKKSENLSDLSKKDRNKRHSSPFINVVKGVFFVVRITLVPVSYLSSPSAVHSYRVPGKFIRRLKSLKAKIYSYSIFVQQMYWLQDKVKYVFLFFLKVSWLWLNLNLVKFRESTHQRTFLFILFFRKLILMQCTC